MDLLKLRGAIFIKSALKYTVVFLTAVFSIIVSQASLAQTIEERTNCGIPDFDRFTDRGVFLWQNCGTGDWFLRTTNGGLSGELETTGTLRLSSDIEALSGFNLDPGINGDQDLLDDSDPMNIEFRFRVFVTAQDGMDFRIDPDALVCLSIVNSANAPVVVGQNNIEFNRPFNIQTLTAEGCSGASTISPILLLLL